METPSDPLASAQLCHRLGDLHRAADLYRQILQANPDQADALFGLGSIAYRQGRYAEAVRWLHQALAVQPANAILHNNLGAAYCAAGDLSEAEACHLAALRLKPDLPEAYNNLGNILKARGRVEEAITRYRQAVLAGPNYAEAHNNLALALWDEGHWQEALDSFGQATRVKPELGEPYRNRGLLLRELDRLEEAVGDLRRAVSLQPDETLARLYLAVALREQGNLEEASTHFQEVLRRAQADLTPQPPSLRGKGEIPLPSPLRGGVGGEVVEAHYGLGISLIGQNRIVEGVTELREALRLKPELAKAHYHLGHALLRTGDLQEAIGHFQTTRRLKPAEVAPPVKPPISHPTADKLEEALANCREKLTLNPSAETYLHLAVLQRETGRLEEAVEAFRQALLLRPDSVETHLHLSSALRSLGRKEEATAHCRQALQFPPLCLPPASGGDTEGGAEAHCQLGVLLREQGQAEEAAAAFRHALRIRPDFAEAHHQLGMTLKTQKHLDEAVAYCTKALQLAPGSADTYVTLGAILAEQGKLEEAVTSFRHALRIEPRHVEAWVKLATALREQGRLDSAVAHLEHALRLPLLYQESGIRSQILTPDSCPLTPGAEAHYQLGLALAEQEKPDEAIRHYREALRLKPDWVPALSHLGILLEESGQTEEGRRLVERALTLGPEQVPVRVNCGISLANQGRLPEAREQFLKALSADPDCAAAYFFLARESKHSFTPAEIGRIKELLGRDGLPLRDRINLHFTMARILDHDKAYDDAFRHCERANACKKELLRLQGNTFRADIHHRFVDRLTATFDHDYFQRTQDFGTPSDLPVFIVGMPRSGTSLVEQILASHPSVHGAGEIPALRQLVATLPAELGTSADYPECLSRLDRQTSRRLADQYLERLRQLGGEKLRVTDKVPMNFHQLGLIGTLFPRAQIIHCRRDPRDISWSCYFQNFREVHFACDLAMLGAYYREYERLMAHWKAVLPVPVLDVCYEELVEDVERVSRQIVSFCRLPWHDACLSFYETRRMVRTASNTQVRRPIYKDSLGKWKNYAAHLGPLFTALGEGNEKSRMEEGIRER